MLGGGLAAKHHDPLGADTLGVDEHNAPVLFHQRRARGAAEAVTRLSGRADPVPDEIWDEAARQYDERGLAALILWIATTNLFDRVNVTTRQAASQIRVVPGATRDTGRRIFSAKATC